MVDPERGAASTRPGARPGPLPTTTTGYSPGGNGRGSAAAQLRHRFALRSRRACAWSIRYITGGWATQERLDRGPGQDEAAQRPEGDDVGDRRLAEEDRDLAEELAAAERRPLLCRRR